ncbi:MAG: thioredoxin [Candidatus Makaraimicrobium thalassicum]|nr:MAG: thioredoxin [Candidatus Omnitrophota bacterium]
MAVNVTDANFEHEVLSSDVPVLVDFWAEWCMPCKMVAPAVGAIAEEYKGRLKVCKLNVDEGRQTAVTYGVMSIPTLAVFKNGEIVDKVIGVLPKNEIETAIKPHI